MTLSAPPAVAEAPAKVILLGEHAVVYGHPALALPFPMLTARATLKSAGVTSVSSDRYAGEVSVLGQDVRPEVLAPVMRAVEGSLEALEKTETVLRRFHLHLESGIPPASGLGSSAAVAVAAVRGVYAFHDRIAPPALVRMLATEAESLAHGASSGLDPSAICADGPIRFVRHHAPVELRVVAPFGLVVADTGENSETAVMVRRVRSRVEHHPADRERLEQIAELCEKGVQALEAGHYAELGQLMDQNHEHLAALGLSTPKMQHVLAQAHAAGAYGAKLTGAGGGGCAVALVPLDRLSAVALAMRDAGCLTCWPTQYRLEAKGSP